MTPDNIKQGTQVFVKDQQTNMNPRIEEDRQLLIDAKQKGGLSVLKSYLKLSGPGWLQSGITLGGGSLSSSLYLGVLVGFSFLWLQPVAMILGIIMLSAISYVTLSTGQRPLRGINKHVSPVLGWGWLIAAMMANIVWSMPQFSLGTAAIQQNILPGVFGGGPDCFIKDPFKAKLIVSSGFLAVCIIVAMLYDTGGRGVRIFEYIMKAVVTLIVLCFFGVVIKLSMEGKILWREILSGLAPDFGLFVKPSSKLIPHIQQVSEQFQSFWTTMIVKQQRDVMISAVATAVGINMTFMLPYSMLRKGWDKHFRGLAIFDLGTALFFPFVLATGCVIIASGSQFHAIPASGFVADTPDGQVTEKPASNLVGPYKGLLKNRLEYQISTETFGKLTDEQVSLQIDALPWADKRMAAMLVTRDSFNLADTLTPLTGSVFAQYIFGLGVIGMAISTAIILMTINGLCFSELLNKPPKGWPLKVGILMVGVGVLGPFFWKDAAPYLAVPTSLFGMTLLPIAYFAFFFLMNQKSYLGESAPAGVKKLVWNILMAIASGAAMFGAFWSLWSKLRWFGVVLLGIFIALCLVVHFARSKPKAA
ncbi:MAG: divalent metal cation transporter [Sedimentisphaerales bacterium]|nr:divalent metal cation transporter [Sedimentisphaerales bacterium]